jgi:peptide/nickel transport system permease protein
MTEAGAAQVESEREFESHVVGGALEGELVRAATMREHFWILIKRSHLLKIGLFFVFVFVTLAAIGPWIGHTATGHDLTAATDVVNASPSSNYLFGTDGSGFDIFARVLASPRIDVTIAIVATLLSLTVGSLIGLMTSFFRGFLGEIVMRMSDVVQAFPLFVLAIVFVVMAGRSYVNIVIVIALLNVPIYLRLIRSEVLTLRERTFVEAARANGDYGLSIAIRHVLPNAMSPGFAQASITLGYSIIITAGLSFIGAGVQPPTPEWGSMIAAGANGIIIGQWWPSVFPGLAMSLCVFGFAVVGEALQAVILRRQ